jgi:hypothetical protein
MRRVRINSPGELIERLMTHIHPALETIDLAFPAMSANNVELERTPGTASFEDAFSTLQCPRFCCVCG